MNFTQQNAKFVINFTSVCEVSAYRTRVSHNFECKNDTRVARETERERESERATASIHYNAGSLVKYIMRMLEAFCSHHKLHVMLINEREKERVRRSEEEEVVERDRTGECCVQCCKESADNALLDLYNNFSFIYLFFATQR